MTLPVTGYVQQVEIVVGGTLPRAGFVQPVEISGGGGFVTGGGVANQLAYWNGATSLTGNAAFTVNDATPSLTVGAITLSSAAGARFIESGDGASASVSGAATGRIRYNNTTGTWQISTQGGAYTNIATGAMAIGGTVTGGIAGRVLFVGAGPVLAQDAGLTYDSAADKLSILGTTGPQLVIGDDANKSITFRFRDIGTGFFHFDVAPTTPMTVAQPYPLWNFVGSDLVFSCDGSSAAWNGLGVPIIVCAGPPSGLGYTEASGPGYVLNNLAAPANNGLWGTRLTTGGSGEHKWVFEAVNDANNASVEWLSVTRTAQNIDAVDVMADNFKLHRMADSTKTYWTYVAGDGSVNFLTPQSGLFTWRSSNAVDALQLSIQNGGTPRITTSGGTLELVGNLGMVSADLSDTTHLYTDNTGDFHILPNTGNKGILLTGVKLSFFDVATPIVKQTSGENLTNNVTAGGTDGTIANYTDLTTYANDAAAIRNDIYQLARKLKQVNDGLRAYGLLT